MTIWPYEVAYELALGGRLVAERRAAVCAAALSGRSAGSIPG